MDITHSYIGTTRGEYAWRFYLLLSEPMERHRQLSEELLTFARDLGERGVLIRPFDQDVGSTMNQVLGKDWPEECWSWITESPGLLAMEAEFAEFDPRRDRWLHVRLSGAHRNELLRQLAQVVRRVDRLSREEDWFERARRELNLRNRRDVARRDLKISVPFGVSITPDALLTFVQPVARVGPRSR